MLFHLYIFIAVNNPFARKLRPAKGIREQLEVRCQDTLQLTETALPVLWVSNSVFFGEIFDFMCPGVLDDVWAFGIGTDPVHHF